MNKPEVDAFLECVIKRPAFKTNKGPSYVRITPSERELLVRTLRRQSRILDAALRARLTALAERIEADLEMPIPSGGAAGMIAQALSSIAELRAALEASHE